MAVVASPVAGLMLATVAPALDRLDRRGKRGGGGEDEGAGEEAGGGGVRYSFFTRSFVAASTIPASNRLRSSASFGNSHSA